MPAKPKPKPKPKPTPSPSPEPEPEKPPFVPAAGRDKRGHWLPGASANPLYRLKPGHKWRFKKGQSGNPAGVSKRRKEFALAFYHALTTLGSPAEAAKLLWEAARAKEPWAMQLLLSRIAPEDSKLRLEISRGQDEIDFTKLSNTELEDLERILEHARPIETISGRALPPQSEDVH